MKPTQTSNLGGAPAQGKKLDQFLEEIQALEKEYQYKMIPSIQFDVDGVVPFLRVVETVPGKKERIIKKKNGK